MTSDTHARSALEAVSWRVLGTVTTAGLVFIFTRKLVLSLSVGALEFVSKIGLFWMHERIWERIRLGKRASKPSVVWFTGLSGSGKSTIAEWVTAEMRRRGLPVEHLDGDTIRDMFPQTGFSREERNAHVRRVGYMASRLEANGVFVVTSLISPYEESRAFVRGLCRNFVEVYVATPIEECERRDVKGLYAKARSGEIGNFTGIDDPYEIPANPEVLIDTRNMTVEEAGDIVLQSLVEKKRRRNGSPARHRSPEHLHPARSLRELQAAGDAVVHRQG